MFVEHRRIVGTSSITLAIALLAVALLAAVGQGASASAVEDSAHNFVANEVVVRFDDDATAADRRSVRNANDVSIKQSLPVEDAQLLTIEDGSTVTEVVRALEGDDAVAYAEPNFLRAANVIPNDTIFTQLWGMNNTGQTVSNIGGSPDADIDAPEAWNTETGDPNVTVAIVDTGIDYNHPDLDDNVWTNPGETGGGKETNGLDDDNNGKVDDWRGWDFYNGDNNPMDDHFHGTHVAGTVAGEGNNNEGVAGVSWTSKVMALKFLNAAGSGTSAGSAAALSYAGQAGVEVVNGSYGSESPSQLESDAITQNPNTLYVFAAGNDGVDNDTSPHFPCAYSAENLVCVAASTSSDTRASFSNYGAESVDLAAPGVNTWSAKAAVVSNVSGNYFAASGTSMASPHVAGAAALLASASPDSSTMTLKNALMDGVDAKSAFATNTIAGGRLNVNNSLNLLDTGSGSIKVLISGNRLNIAAPAGQADEIDIAQGGSTITVSAIGNVTNFGGCTQDSSVQVSCPTADFASIRVETGDGPDSIDVAASVTKNSSISSGTGNDIVNGGSGDDVIDPGTDLDVITGGAGIDTADYHTRTMPVNLSLDGDDNDGESGEQDTIGGGIENLRGGASSDVLTGDSGNNVLRGEGGIDTLDGADGDDSLDGGTQADTIVGGNGVDVADYGNRYGGVNVSLDGQANDGATNEGDLVSTSIENVAGGAGADTLTGDENANELFGNAGDDTLLGGAEADILHGGTGYDSTSYSDRSNRVEVTLDGNDDDGELGENDNIGADIENIKGGAGDDMLSGSAGDNVLTGGPGADDLYGQGGIDTASYIDKVTSINVTIDDNDNDGTSSGAEGDNVATDIENVDGSSGDDTLTGDDNDNRLDGFSGTDTLSGGAGNDTLVGQGGPDSFDGGDGTDKVDYSDSYSSLTLTIDGNANDGTSGGAEGDNIELSVEDVEAGHAIDSVTGSSFDNVLIGGQQTDVISGGDGNDTIIADGPQTRGPGCWTFSLGHDTLNGDGGGDTLYGGHGTDALNGGDGNDTLNPLNTAAEMRGFPCANVDGDSDTFNGGAGIDTADYSTTSAPTKISLDGVANDGSVNQAIDNVLGDVENVTGSDGADVISGDANANTLSGGSGDDTINGGGGTDVLNGADGSDSIVSDGDSLVDDVDCGNGIDFSTSEVIDDVQNCEHINEESIVVSVNDGVLRIDGASNRADNINVRFLNEGGGEFWISDSTNTISAPPTCQSVSTHQTDCPAEGVNSVEIHGGTLNDSIRVQGVSTGDFFTVPVDLYGESGNDSLQAGGSDNNGATAPITVHGGSGDDSLQSFFGTQEFYGGDGTDSILFASSTSLRAVGITASIDDVPNDGEPDEADNVHSDIESIWGTTYDDTLIGNDGYNILVGLQGDDTLDGKLGGDNLSGGAGSDTADYSERSASITANLTSGSGLGQSGEGDFVPYSDVENLIGGSDNDLLTGKSGTNILTGGPGDDVLNGLAGDDVLHGDEGEDTLNGGDDSDTLHSIDTSQDLDNCGTGGTDNDVVNADGFDLIDDCEQVNLNVDTAIDSGPNNPTNDSTPTFEFRAEPTGSATSFECRNTRTGETPDAFAACESPFTLPALSAGEFTFEVRAVSASAIPDPSPASWTYEVDITGPMTEIVYPAEGAFIAGPVDVEWTGEGPFAWENCYLDGYQVYPCTSPFTVSAEGPHEFHVGQSDTAGNSNADLVNFTIDTTAPTVNVTAPSGTSNNAVTVISFDLFDVNGTSNTECAIDGGTPFACASGQQLPALPDGPHSVEVTTVDPAGNVGSGSRSFAIDTTPPETVFDTGPSGYTPDSTPDFTFHGEPLDDVGGYECRVYPQGNPGAWSWCSTTSPNSSGAHTGGPLSDGAYTFEVRAQDHLGTIDQSPASRDFTVDTTLPSLTISAPGGTIADNTPEIQYSTSDASGITSQLCRIDSGAWTPCSSGMSWATPLTDGAYMLYVTVIDGAGNSSLAASPFTVDTTAPDTTIDSSGSPLLSDNTPTFTFGGVPTSDTSEFDCRIYPSGSPVAWGPCSDSAVNGAGSHTSDPLADGDYTIEVRAKDSVGNTDATPDSWNFTIDTHSPSLSISAPSGTVADNTPLIEFTASDSSGIASQSCRIDSGSWVPCTSGSSWETALTDGPHTLWVLVVDGAGNSISSPRAFEVDTTPPETQITLQPSAVTGDNTPTWEFTSSESGSTFECSIVLNPAPHNFTSCSSPFTSAPLADGTYKFAVRATDAVGNVDPSEATQTSLVVDTTPPNTSILSQPYGPTGDNTPTWTFNATQAGSTFECSVVASGAPHAFNSCSSPFTSGVLADGSYDFAVRATDPAGNVDATPAVQTGLVIDTTPPNTVIDSGPAEGSVTDDKVHTFTFRGVPVADTDAFQCRIDGGTWTSCGTGAYGSYTTPELANGVHTFEVRARDARLNYDQSPASRSFTVQATAPAQLTKTGPATITSPLNLTAEGTADWAYWGRSVVSDFDHKASGGLQIPNYTQIGSAATPTRITSTPNYSWSDGIPTASATSNGGVSVGGASGRGFRITAPASQTTRTLKVYVGVLRTSGTTTASGRLTATLSDGSAASVTDTTVTNASNTAATDRVFTLTYRSAAPSATLTVEWTQNSTTSTHRVRLYSASLSSASDVTPPPAPTISSPAEGATVTTPTTAVSFTGEAGASFQCKTDSGSFAACSSPYTTPTLSDGQHTVKVRAIDGAGNIGPATTRTFNVAVPQRSATVSVADAPASLNLTTVGSETTIDWAQWGYSSSSSGNYRNRKSGATDLIGLYTGSGTVSRQTTGAPAASPAISWTGGTPTATVSNTKYHVSRPSVNNYFELNVTGSTTNMRTLRLYVGLNQASGYLQLFWGSETTPFYTSPTVQNTTGASFKEYAIAFRSSSATEKLKARWVQSADHGTNRISLHAATLTQNADSTAPETTINTGPADNEVITTTTPTFGFSASEAAQFQCRVDTAAFTSCSSPFTTASLSNGQHSFEVRAIDTAGNIDPTPAKRTFVVEP